MQTYTGDPSNVALDGAGHLLITARRDDDGTWTSARVHTAGRRSVRHGLVQVRARLPVGTGIWPAAWTLGESLPQVGWPRCGEVDLIETVGDGAVRVQTVHGADRDGGHWQRGVPVPPGPPLSERFHVFAADCGPDQVVFSVDDVVTGVVSADDVPPGGSWACDGPHHLLLDVAVGGHWPGPPDASTPPVVTMVVDWVRLHG
ncbi:glycoside hydrolase family 16 protein [Goekera deserti]|uniref:glycoside hydrolase family 16 protein n=1 Tax=Goekera deserti TaxID=2497753 RepID=UPI0022A667AE|nr:glycoside hydrolase family 16 protein [Goekera deserti]